MQPGAAKNKEAYCSTDSICWPTVRVGNFNGLGPWSLGQRGGSHVVAKEL